MSTHQSTAQETDAALAEFLEFVAAHDSEDGFTVYQSGKVVAGKAHFIAPIVWGIGPEILNPKTEIATNAHELEIDPLTGQWALSATPAQSIAKTVLPASTAKAQGYDAAKLMAAAVDPAALVAGNAEMKAQLEKLKEATAKSKTPAPASALFDCLQRLISQSATNPILRVDSKRVALEMEDVFKIEGATSFANIYVGFVSEARALAILESEALAVSVGMPTTLNPSQPRRPSLSL